MDNLSNRRVNSSIVHHFGKRLKSFQLNNENFMSYCDGRCYNCRKELILFTSTSDIVFYSTLLIEATILLHK